jgi:pyruvate dehydrogenase E2 component (dihydrolipoamide acetyltransferase)
MKIIVTLALLLMAVTSTTLFAKTQTLEDVVKETRRGLGRAGMTRRTIDVDGNRVVYFAGGRGARTIVLVHGVNDQAGTWVAVVPALMKDARVIAIDLPGHGESAPATGPLPLPMMVKAVAAILDRESPDAPVVLAGNSMGGWVSILYAADHPARVAHLVLEDASGMMWDMSHVNFFPKNREEAIKVLRLVHGPDAPIPDYLVDTLLKTASSMPQARVLQAGVLTSLVDLRLKDLTMPVTLIWGAHDGLLPTVYAEALHAKIAGSTLHVINDAAHIPHRQAPKEFIRLMHEAIQ